MRRAFSKPVDPLEVSELLRGFRAAGYEGLQLKGSQYGEFVSDPERAKREIGDDPAIYSAIIAGDRLDDEGLQRIGRLIDFASAIGSERIVFCHAHPHDGVDAAQRRQFARTLTEVAKRARDQGVAFSLHHHVDQPVMVLADFREFFDGLEPGTLGLTVDTAHLAKAGVTDLPGFVHEFWPHIDNIHLKDFDGEWQLPGEGDLDLVGFLDALDWWNYSGWLCIDEETTTPLPEAFARARAWLDEQGR